MIQPDELRELCQRIIASGELGRSKTYAAILEYLAEQAISSSTPKEISIAMDVLGRGSDFDVGKDSIVRVHIYHLRNKLNAYYARAGKEEKYRLDIPKGQYMLATSPNVADEVDAGAVSITGRQLQRASLTPWLAGLAFMLLLFNFYQNWTAEQTVTVASNPYADSALWKPFLDDQQPVLILVGDYYIMGEIDNNGSVNRMVREFEINSQQDLQFNQQNGRNRNYMNLDLSYTPTSVSAALVQVMKVLGADGKRVNVKMMSDFNTNDLVGNHIIYLGYLSGLQSLNDLMFAASNLATGITYDQLVNLDDDTLYTSSSGLSTGADSFRDYGLLSTFPSPSGTQYLFIAGMRDEGLINLAEEITMLPSLHELQQALPAKPTNSDTAFEALYEVLGFNNTNFDAKLVYSSQLDTKVLWETRLIGIQ